MEIIRRLLISKIKSDHTSNLKQPGQALIDSVEVVYFSCRYQLCQLRQNYIFKTIIFIFLKLKYNHTISFFLSLSPVLPQLPPQPSLQPLFFISQIHALSSNCCYTCHIIYRNTTLNIETQPPQSI